MKTCPNCQHTFADDSYNFCLQDGSSLIVLNEPEIETVISHKNLKAEFDEPEIETVISHKNFRINSSTNSDNILAVINEPIIAINIAQQYPYVKNDFELYQVTRGLWRLSRKRAETAEYAFAVYKGEIKEVYKIDNWEPARFDSSEFWVKRKKEQGVEINPAINKGRYQFIGKVANSSVRLEYVGKQMPVPHGQNPIRYFNC